MSTSLSPGPDHLAGQSLRRAEAESRRALLEVTGYDVDLDLSGADSPDTTTFLSRTTIDLVSGAGDTFVDLKPVDLVSVTLDGDPIDPDRLERGRYPLTLGAGPHRLVVEARMRFRNDGEGLHRSIDPVDGRAYVYGMSFMDAAPSIFACFDQPDLKAPYTVAVTAPRAWEVVGNGAAVAVTVDGRVRRWQLATTHPLSTYFVTLVAGPYHLVRSEHDGIPLGLSARASLASTLDAEADELFTLTGQCFDELHRLFGIRYPFGDYHQAFVPEFNAGAMENPGCVTFRDQMLFDTRVTRASRINRATTVAHEMAHQWFGNIVTPRWWDDLWLNESFAEYLGNRVTADATQYDDAWAHHSFARRQWGLNADQRPSTHPVAGNGAADALSALQDFDGISYAKGSAVLKQLVSQVGDEVFLGGVVDHIEAHRFGNATMADLVGSWQRAGAGDLAGFTDAWLSHAGLDTLSIDRAAGGVRREHPVVGEPPAAREHATTIAVASGTGPDATWTRHPLAVVGDLTLLDGPGGPGDLGSRAVVLDPDEETWAASCVDDTTLAALPALAGAATTEADPALRSALWNNVRSAFHLARVDPAAVLEVVVAAPPLDDLGDVGTRTLPWTVGTLLPLAAAGSTARVHDAVLARLGEAEPGSDTQLQALRGAIHTAGTAAVLRGWLERLPTGLDLDQDLRWRLLVRLAVLGEVTREELDDALAAEPSTMAGVEHARAVASRPDPAAKQWAWDRFTGAVDAPNHVVEAAGAGLWQAGQLDLTEPYVERYAQDLPGTAAVRSGWTLALSAASFFPHTQVDNHTVARMRTVADDPDLEPAVRRRVIDSTDDLSRSLAVARAYPQDSA